MSSKRFLQVDILRIIAMFSIVTLYVINLGGALNLLSFNVNALIIRIVYILSFASVNIFAMITGYLYCNKESVKVNRLVDLLIVTLLWSLIITSVLYILGYINGIKEIVVSLFPFLRNRYWYIVCYVFVYLLIPYINRFIHGMSKIEMKRFILITLLLMSVIPTVMITDIFRENTGSSPWWLIECYIIGAYFRKYGVVNTKKYLYAFLISLSFVLLWWNGLECITIRLFGESKMTMIFFKAYYTIPNVLMSVSIFVFFMCHSFSIKSQIESMIHSLSSKMFGVYIIHSHIFLWERVITHILHRLYNYSLNVVFVLGCILVLFVICIILECVREYLFKLFKIDRIISKIKGEVKV